MKFNDIISAMATGIVKVLYDHNRHVYALGTSKRKRLQILIRDMTK
jgi:hypothetical protein